MAKDRIYRWIKGSKQYANLKADLAKSGWKHHLDFGRRSDAFRSAGSNGIVIGWRKEHPLGRDTYTVYKKM